MRNPETEARFAYTRRDHTTRQNHKPTCYKTNQRKEHRMSLFDREDGCKCGHHKFFDSHQCTFDRKTGHDKQPKNITNG
jgi:hypothetical protein